MVILVLLGILSDIDFLILLGNTIQNKDVNLVAITITGQVKGFVGHFCGAILPLGVPRTLSLDQYYTDR